MDPEAFVSCLYGYMSEKRKKLVLRVFDKLDTTGTGHVKLDQVGRTSARATCLDRWPFLNT